MVTRNLSTRFQELWLRVSRTQVCNGLVLAAAIGLVFVPSIACAEETPTVVSPALMPTSSTRVTPGCVISLTVLDEAQLTGDFPVDARGLVHLSLADEDGGHKQAWTVAVSSMTAEQARNAIAISLKKYYLDPNVQFQIKTLPALTVEVAGPVRNAGLLKLPLAAHLSDVIVLCEPTTRADLTNVHILRSIAAGPKVEPGRKTLLVNFQAFNEGTSEEDPVLEAGDRILLTARPDVKPDPLKPAKPVPQFVHIHGEVNTEADLPLTPGLTVKEALDRVGGLKPGAEHGKIHLARLGGGYMALETDKVQADDPEANRTLQPDDLLLVFPGQPAQHYAVMGAVLAPKTFDMKPGEKVTVLSALLAAGGPTKKTDPHHAMLSQGYLLDPTKARSLPFDPELVAKGKQPNMAMQSGDALILFPKEHKATIWQKLLPFAFRFLPLPF